MFTKIASSAAIAAALLIAPLSQASAHDGYHHYRHGGLGLLPFLAAGAVIGAAVAAPPVYVAPPPYYAAPGYYPPPAYVYARPGYAYPYGYYRGR